MDWALPTGHFAEGAPCWLDLGLCYGLGSPTAHLGQAQTTNAKRAPLLAGLRSLLQPGLPNLFKSKLQRGRRRLYQKLSVAVTDYIISVHACKSYAINAVSGFTKKCLLVMYTIGRCTPVKDGVSYCRHTNSRLLFSRRMNFYGNWQLTMDL